MEGQIGCGEDWKRKERRGEFRGDYSPESHSDEFFDHTGLLNHYYRKAA